MVATIAFKIDELRDYAARGGLSLNFVVKEAFLFELMESVRIKGFVLKGGTAINKGYLDGHQRFSEDLDYDTDLDLNDAKKYIRNLGWEIKKEFFTKHSIGFMMAYRFEGIRDVVRLDLSFGVKKNIEMRRVSSDFIPVSKIVSMYDFGELNHQKESAFEERKEWKDAYDLYWMHELYPSEFRIGDRAKFKEVLSNIRVPKFANAYIPAQKRPNWDEVIEKLRQAAK
ncbi:MAG: nucleotidyl transferase AbiEii/AbiGii toxin family protein [Candidatus Micrarchaeota archaeon]|nr:nucleotidyl transferase AbiEii/AbiGii toxin family protein [Candidatus Micrarchaeota archaeon]MDE1864297.1 nucleotidyl transferase AbiEii/AbiGii toxin family protein [Candidatus Micrarchaeota archaeon]